jgi:DNA-binding transcriptional MerR regulator
VAQSGWRIDELAQKTGLTVDTIRYYCREGLLMAPERAGRHKLYGTAHLERLEQIRRLQEQRFSLAAISAILNTDRPGLEGLFGTQGGNYTFDDLIERTEIDRTFVERLRKVGLLANPNELGRESYDDGDLAMLRAVAELREIGMTDDLLVELGAIYVRHFRALQADVHNMLAGHDRTWDPDELVALQRTLTANSARMIPAIDRVLHYVHQTTVQRLTLEAMHTAEETGTGIGGLRLVE